MKIIKENKVDDTFVSSVKEHENYYNEKYIVCGKSNQCEFKTLVKFDLNKIRKLARIENNIEKVELCVFLIETKLDTNSENVMINIGENLQNFNCSTVTYATAPKVKQKPCFYVVKPEYKNQYINFNITNLVREHKGNGECFSLSVLPISDGGIAFFASSRTEKKPYIKIYYKCDDDNCNPEDISNKAYGLFINNTGEIKYEENLDFIVWNRACHVKGMEIAEDNSKIIIKEPGVYQIDCSVDIRTENSTYMSIFLNGVEIKYSRNSIGVTEQQSIGQTLIQVCKNNSSLQLGIKKTKMMLVNNGVASSIRIIRV